MFLEILRPEVKDFAWVLKGAPLGNKNAAGPHNMNTASKTHPDIKKIGPELRNLGGEGKSVR